MNVKFVTIAPLLLALGSVPLAMGQTKGANPPEKAGTSAGTTSGAITDTKPVEDLQLAAQRLRDAIHAMVREPASSKRIDMIKAGDRALAEVENAMSNLPPALLTAEASESHYKDAGDRLDKAVQNLHDATQALAKDPNSKRRNETIKKIKTALLETHRLMQEIPRGVTAK